MRDNIIAITSIGKESGRNRGIIPEVQEEELKEEPTAKFPSSDNMVTVGGGVKTGTSMGGGNLMKDKVKADKAAVRPDYGED